MDYNATSIAGVDFNPAQFLMNRRIKTSLIISTELLKLMTYSNEEIRQKLEAKQTLTKLYYDSHAKKDYYDGFEPGD